MPEYQAVSPTEWRISSSVSASRKQSLENPDSASGILDQLQSVAEAAAVTRQISLRWQEADEKVGFFRLICEVPIPPKLFDQFFNGRSGYRAQYYRSPDSGAVYNAAVIDSLFLAIKMACLNGALDQPFELVQRSLRGSWSKLWIVGDGGEFDNAALGLEASRWVKYWSTRESNRGLKIPLPQMPKLDIKGTFVDPSSFQEFIDETKIDRSMSLYNSGWC